MEPVLMENKDENANVVHYIGAADRCTAVHANGGTAFGNDLTMHACPRSSNYPNCLWILEASPTRPGMYYIKASDQSMYIHAAHGTHATHKLTMHGCPKAADYANCQWALEASSTRPGMYYIKASDQSTYIHADGGTVAGHELTMHACPKGADYANCQWSLVVPQAPYEYTKINDAADCCRSNGAEVGSVSNGAATTPDACQSHCDANAQCKFFSHSLALSNCALCAQCDFTTTGFGATYTSWQKKAPCDLDCPYPGINENNVCKKYMYKNSRSEDWQACPNQTPGNWRWNAEFDANGDALRCAAPPKGQKGDDTNMFYDKDEWQMCNGETEATPKTFLECMAEKDCFVKHGSAAPGWVTECLLCNPTSALTSDATCTKYRECIRTNRATLEDRSVLLLKNIDIVSEQSPPDRVAVLAQVDKSTRACTIPTTEEYSRLLKADCGCLTELHAKCDAGTTDQQACLRELACAKDDTEVCPEWKSGITTTGAPNCPNLLMEQSARSNISRKAAKLARNGPMTAGTGDVSSLDEAILDKRAC